MFKAALRRHLPIRETAWLEWVDLFLQLLSAGFSVLEALKLSLSLRNAPPRLDALHRPISQIIEKLEHGQSLSTVSQESGAPHRLIQAFQCASESGDLILELSQQIERWKRYRKQLQELRQSLAYPVFVLMSSLASSLFIYQQLAPSPNTESPIKLDLGSLLVLIGLLSTSLLLALRTVAKAKNNTSQISAFLNPFTSLFYAQHFYMIASKLAAGHDLIECLKPQDFGAVSRHAIRSKQGKQLQRMCASLQQGVIQGLSLEAACRRAQAPELLTIHLALASQTGNLSKAFYLTACAYEVLGTQQLRRLKKVLGPLCLGLSALTLLLVWQQCMAPLYQFKGL